MTDWLEFHDSVLMRCDAREAGCELLLDAYVHRWERTDAGWTGTGWMQQLRIVLSNAVSLPVMPALPVDIADGWVRVGEVFQRNMVRLPMQASGAITVCLQLSTAEIVEVTGSGVRIASTMGARFVEELPAEMRPHELD